MDVGEAIHRRRAYRSLAPVEITAELVEDLAEHVRLAPSCFNNQPWRFVFVSAPEVLGGMREALSPGNEWAHAASLIVAVMSRKEDDCVIREREYHQFDTGMATAFLILRATELGLVAHPIAGYSPARTRAVLGIPDDYAVITLVIVGRKAAELSPVLQPHQVEAERERPARLPRGAFAFRDRFPAPAPAAGEES
jgi:nitroreductase